MSLSSPVQKLLQVVEKKQSLLLQLKCSALSLLLLTDSTRLFMTTYYYIHVLNRLYTSYDATNYLVIICLLVEFSSSNSECYGSFFGAPL